MVILAINREHICLRGCQNTTINRKYLVLTSCERNPFIMFLGGQKSDFLSVVLLLIDIHICISVCKSATINVENILFFHYPVSQCLPFAGSRVYFQKCIFNVRIFDDGIPLSLILGKLSGISDISHAGGITVRTAGL